MGQRQDRLTQDEVQITTTQIHNVLHSLVQDMDGEQIHQVCWARVVEHPSSWTASEGSTHLRLPSVCSVGLIQ